MEEMNEKIKTEDKRELCGNLAVENYKKGLNCCESVFDALLRAGVLEAPEGSTAMCIGFGAGIGMTGQTCGALSGIIMANGACYGRKDPWSVEEENRGAEVANYHYRRYNHIVHDFSKEFGACDCKSITQPHGAFGSKERKVACLKLIANSAKMAYDYLMLSPEEAGKLSYQENIAKRQD